jgi:hypothetical protein
LINVPAERRNIAMQHTPNAWQISKLYHFTHLGTISLKQALAIECIAPQAIETQKAGYVLRKPMSAVFGFNSRHARVAAAELRARWAIPRDHNWLL